MDRTEAGGWVRATGRYLRDGTRNPVFAVASWQVECASALWDGMPLTDAELDAYFNARLTGSSPDTCNPAPPTLG